LKVSASKSATSPSCKTLGVSLVERKKHVKTIQLQKIKATAERIITTAERISAYAEKNIATAERIIITAERIIATAERIIATSERIIATAERIIATSERISAHRRNALWRCTKFHSTNEILRFAQA
jgi:hypothetical protein